MSISTYAADIVALSKLCDSLCSRSVLGLEAGQA